MLFARRQLAASLVLSVAIVPLSQARAADCAGSAGGSLVVGPCLARPSRSHER
jgi:hypothetical protein